MKHWKCTLGLVLCLVMTLAVTPNRVFASEGSCGDNLTWKLDEGMDEGTLIISGEGDMYDFESGSLPWRFQLNEINKIIIEDGVTHIGNYAFEYAENLTDVTMPGSLTSIGCNAFAWCNKLGNITIPDSVTRIDGSAFWRCSSLSGMTIGNSVTSIGSDAFKLCYNLTEITIPASVEKLGSSVFEDCSGLTDVIFQGNAPELGFEMFDGVTATVHYPCSDETWTDDVRKPYGGALTWVTKHTEVVDREKKEATCGEDGHEKVSHCSACRQILSDAGTIPATGEHTEVIDMEAKAPTCVEDGHEKVSHCSVCEKSLSRGTRIPSTGVHTEVIDKSVKATSTKTGLTEGSHCADCGKVIRKQTLTLAKPVLTSGTKNIATRKIVVKWYKNSTCTGYQVKYVTGSTTKTVKVSGKSTLSKTLSSLKKGRTYKVYVRCYKTVGSKTYYSPYSAYKSVKVAK